MAVGRIVCGIEDRRQIIHAQLALLVRQPLVVQDM